MTDAPPTPRDVIADALCAAWHIQNATRDADNVIFALTSAGYVIEPGWRDIASAPRGGKPALFFAPAAGQEYPLDKWRVDTWREGGWWQMRPAQPYTYWRPLPAGPTTEGDAT